MATDRSHYPVRRVTLAEEGRKDDYAHLSPEERLAMVEELSKQAWAFTKDGWDERRLDRHVVRVIRGGG